MTNPDVTPARQPARSKTPNGGRPSIREEQKQRTRDRLLDAAFEVFREIGFRAATVDEIMKRAGANRATFYLHFTDKLDIAAGLGRRSATAVAERFRLLDNLVAPARADVRAWLEDDLANRRQERVSLGVIQEVLSADPRFGQEYLDYFGRLGERVMVNTVARWPEEQRPLARCKITCLFIMLHRVEFHLLSQELNFGDCNPLEALTDILWNELFCSAVASSAGTAAA
jgi:AcrR family transcriptional regulator